MIKNINNKKTLYYVIALIFLLIIGISCSIFIYRHESSQCTAYIYQDGTLIEAIDLNNVSENYTFDIYGDNGAFNTVEVHPGEIGIVTASCPDKVCINMGFIKNDMLPITCLPNKLVIQIKNGTPDFGEVDGWSY